MTWRFLFEDEATKSVNLTPATWPAAVFNLKRALKAAGWVVVSSGTGTGLAYDAAADIITHGGGGAGGLDNPKAWFQIRDPNSKVWLTFQKDTTASAGNSYSWRVKASISVFNAGVPGVDRTPIPTVLADEQIMVGGGLESTTPTFAQLFYATNGSCRQEIFADATTGSFGCVMFRTGRAGTECTSIAFDKFATQAAAADPAPFVVDCIYRADRWNYLSQYATLGPWKNAKLGAGRAWVQCNAGVYGSYSGASVPTSYGTNAEDSKDNPLDVIWCRDTALAAPTGIFGKSQIFRWTTVARAFGDLGTEATAGDLAVFNMMVTPWNGDAVTI